MSEKKLFVVDVLVTTRMRYVVKAKSLDDAYDEVTMRESGNPDDEFDEFSQKDLGTMIIDGYQITKNGFDQMNKQLTFSDSKETGSPWMGRDIIRNVKYNK